MNSFEEIFVYTMSQNHYFSVRTINQTYFLLSIIIDPIATPNLT